MKKNVPMGKTTADVPPQIANEYSKARRPQAVSEATGDGYTTTKKMQPGKQRPSQFGLPKSPGVHLRIRVMPDTDGDKM
jgi:hypothetical protein